METLEAFNNMRPGEVIDDFKRGLVVQCPCENCICIPVCKIKEYGKLLDECNTLMTYFHRNVEEINPSDKLHIIERVRKNVLIVEDILQPIRWGVRVRHLYDKKTMTVVIYEKRE